jgi:hypothetical protein
VILPPLTTSRSTLDSDPLIQMFPRCLWADDSTRAALLAESPVIKDLLERLRDITESPADARREQQSDTSATLRPAVDLVPLAKWYESTAFIDLAFSGQDDKDYDYRCCRAFWLYFRAAAIRTRTLRRPGDPRADSASLAHDYAEMSEIMLQVKREDGMIILIGDLAFAEHCAYAACDLAEGTILMDDLAQRQLQRVKQMQQAVSQYPDRIRLRSRYGPFTGQP